MDSEFNALLKNNTRDLAPPCYAENVISTKWVFRLKRDSKGHFVRHKALLVARGFNQREGIDFHETYSPVIKLATIRVVLTLATVKGWKLRQLHINNAFLQGCLHDNVYVTQPPGYIDATNPHCVCKLKKALYWLKQAWFKKLSSFLLSLGFKNSICDSSLFIYLHNNLCIYVLVYVEEIAVTANDDSVLEKFITRLSAQFSLKDLGLLSYFLGVEVQHTSQGLVLNQRQYILDLLVKSKMVHAKLAVTPLAVDPPLTKVGSSNPTEYRALIGNLQYLSITRPNVAFAVNKLAQYMQSPTDDHWNALKRLLRYLVGTIDYGYYSSFSSCFFGCGLGSRQR